MRDIFYLTVAGYIYTESGYIGFAGCDIFAKAVNRKNGADNEFLFSKCKMDKYTRENDLPACKICRRTLFPPDFYF